MPGGGAACPCPPPTIVVGERLANFFTALLHPMPNRCPSNSQSCNCSLASSASALEWNETKPVLRPRPRSSSVRGHMIFTEYTRPNRPNTSCSLSSVVVGDKLLTCKLVVPGSPSSYDPGKSRSPTIIPNSCFCLISSKNASICRLPFLVLLGGEADGSTLPLLLLSLLLLLPITLTGMGRVGMRSRGG